MIAMHPHTGHAGLVVSSKNHAPITSLDKSFLMTKLAEHGYLVLRDFEVGIEGFSRLVRQSSARISLDPARSFNGDTAQKVDAGTAPVGLHCENGNSPFWPDLCWFYCEREPEQGSQTTICDGMAVYEAMSDGDRAAFAAQDIEYSRRVDETKWKTYVLHALADHPAAPHSIADVTVAHLQALAEGSEGTTIVLNSDNSIHYRFRTAAIRKSTLAATPRPSFANSIFGPSYNYETPRIAFADGSDIPAETLAGLAEVCEAHTHEVGWKTGDVVMIDNTRVMHGRREIQDTRRVIYNALSYSA